VKLALYIARLYAVSICLSLFLLVVLVTSVTLIENVGSLARIDGGAVLALRLAVFEAFDYAYQILPITGLLGALVTGAVLARNGELLAMQASGMGPVRILAPCLVVTLMVTGLGLFSGEVVVPWALKNAESIRLEYTRRTSALSRFYNRRTHWFKDGNLILHLPAVNNETGVFKRPSIYDLEDGVVREVIEADTMEEGPAGWILKEVRVHRADGVTFELKKEMGLELGVSTRDLIDVTGNPRHTSRGELINLITRREHAGFDAVAHQVELYSRVAFPIGTFWLFLIAAPWIISPNRRRSMSVNLGGGVIGIALMLSVDQMFRLLALGRKIDPLAGAWGVGVLCIVIAPISWAIQRRVRIRGSLF